MSKYSDDELNTHIKQSLDESTNELDANTLSRIRQIRASAVERVDERKHSWQGIMVGGLATTCVMVLAVMLLLNSDTTLQTVPLDELELISSADNLDLFEDLEFYEWLEEDVIQS
jgi:hypothetical protein